MISGAEKTLHVDMCSNKVTYNIAHNMERGKFVGNLTIISKAILNHGYQLETYTKHIYYELTYRWNYRAHKYSYIRNTPDFSYLELLVSNLSSIDLKSSKGS